MSRVPLFIKSRSLQGNIGQLVSSWWPFEIARCFMLLTLQPSGPAIRCLDETASLYVSLTMIQE
jgi:hypothetical protein